LYFYIYWFFIFFSRNFVYKGCLVYIYIYFSYNYFLRVEQISNVNNFFYTITFKIINIISDIDFNLIIILSLLQLVTWLLNNQRFNYWLYLILLLEVFFYKNVTFDLIPFKQINVNLLSGLFLIHPLILITLILTILYITIKYIGLYKYIQSIGLKLHVKLNFPNFALNLLTILSLLLLLTGGWWAQQELNWGGWWAWDFVELANLNIFIFALSYKHLPKVRLYKTHFLSLWGLGGGMYSIFFVYIYTRYNLIPSIHSFLTDLSFLQYDYFVNFLLCLVFFLLFILF